MGKYWAADSVLNRQTEQTPPKEIYQAVCDAIGHFFENKGFRYVKSWPKIYKKSRDFKLEILFSSSAYNHAGGYVNLEINAYQYSLEIIKAGMGKGFLNSAITPLGKKIKEDFPPRTRVVKQINGETEISTEMDAEYSELVYNRNVNVYKIDEILFEQIIEFIEIRLIEWLEDLVDTEKTCSLLDDCSMRAKKSLAWNDFLAYFRLKHPEMVESIEEKLKS